MIQYYSKEIKDNYETAINNYNDNNNLKCSYLYYLINECNEYDSIFIYIDIYFNLFLFYLLIIYRSNELYLIILFNQ